ncbi:MAG: hypothetical protein FWD77_04225 [Betaproteobacteria bacterium]|nr:hypothetical protein [Betaproteobacteria bacterium]
MPRNRVLMRVFRDVELVESLGSGMTRILSAYERFMPVADDPVDGEVETGMKTGMKTRQKPGQKTGMDTAGQGLCRGHRPRRPVKLLECQTPRGTPKAAPPTSFRDPLAPAADDTKDESVKTAERNFG